MRRAIAALVVVLAYAGSAAAAENGACAVASSLATTDVGLPRVAAAVHTARRLDIAVLGTGSSILAGAGGADIAYPARLQAALAKRLPGVDIKVSSYAKVRQSAAEMTRELGKVLSGIHPSLVIWQTGTVDAMKGIDVDDFRAALEGGVGALQAGGADVILMNMQYSPRTESVIALNAYVDNIRWVAQHREIPLFDRFAIMKHWSELGTFDFSAAANNVETAAQVHECIGQLLGDLIVEGAKLAHNQPKPIQ
jgi:ABC-type amino acid transport substrate-binding protein